MSTPQSTGLHRFNQAISNPRMNEYLTSVLSTKKDSFVSNIVTLVGNSTALQQCEPMTVIYAGMKATALGLSLDPNLGHAYVIPYKDGRQGITQAQFQLGYKAFVQLAIRSGQFKGINVTEVREGELLDMDLLTGELQFKAKPNRHTLAVVGYVAFFELTNGFRKSYYMSREEVQAHRQRFSKAKNSPWDTDFDRMACKTVLKHLLNHYAPLSVEMQTAITSDQAVFRKDINSPEYIDNPRAEEASYEEVVDLDSVRAVLLATDTDEELRDAYDALTQSEKQDRNVLQIVREHRETLKERAEAKAISEAESLFGGGETDKN